MNVIPKLVSAVAAIMCFTIAGSRAATEPFRETCERMDGVDSSSYLDNSNTEYTYRGLDTPFERLFGKVDARRADVDVAAWEREAMKWEGTRRCGLGGALEVNYCTADGELCGGMQADVGCLTKKFDYGENPQCYPRQVGGTSNLPREPVEAVACQPCIQDDARHRAESEYDEVATSAADDIALEHAQYANLHHMIRERQPWDEDRVRSTDEYSEAFKTAKGGALAAIHAHPDDYVTYAHRGAKEAFESAPHLQHELAQRNKRWADRIEAGKEPNPFDDE